MRKSDILCKNGKCPICESQFETKYIKCKNNCYRIDTSYGNFTIVIFDNPIAVFWVEDINLLFSFKKKKRIKKAIKFYKKNDYYLMKILENE